MADGSVDIEAHDAPKADIAEMFASGTPGAQGMPNGPETQGYAERIRGLTTRRIEIFASAGDDWRFAESLKAVSEDTAHEYEDRAVLELLQNAHDAIGAGHRGRVRIILDTTQSPGTLYVANEGQPFTDTNFHSITELGLSDKSADEGIGNKGLGFRSVLQLSDRPEVYSRDPHDDADAGFRGYSFRFAGPEDIDELAPSAELARQVQAKVSPLDLPVPAEVTDNHIRQLATERFATVVKLPLRDAIAADAARSQTENLAVDAPPVLLFLDRIAAVEIEFRDPDAHPGLMLTRTETVPRLLPKGSPNWVREVDLGAQGTYLLARRETIPAEILAAITESVTAHLMDKRWLKWDHESWVGVALRLDAPLAGGRTYTFLPMGEESPSPLAAHIHAPFFTKLARRTISEAVPFNAYLMQQIAGLCRQLWELLRDDGDFAAVSPLVVDLVAWAPPHQQPLVEACQRVGSELMQEVVVPLAKQGSWASLDDAYEWPQKYKTRILTPQALARAGLPIADPAIGTARLERLANLHAALTKTTIEAQPSDIASWVEVVAQVLKGDGASLETWARFYDDLAPIFQHVGTLLAGKAIVLDQDSNLQRAMGAEAKGATRLLFFAPSPEDDGADSAASVRLPKALDSRLVYTHQGIPWNLLEPVKQKRPGRSFLESSGLVREYRTDRLLDVIADLLRSDPNQALQEAAVQFAYALFPNLNIGQRGLLATIRFTLPTESGTWAEASTLAFSAPWGTPGARLLALLLASIRDRLPGFLGQADRLLAAPGAWPFLIDGSTRWIEFLKAIGVQNGLPLDRPAKPAQRNGNDLRSRWLAAEISLPEPLATAWAADVDAAWSQGTNPYTTYSFSGPLVRLPGADQAEELTTEERVLYAQLVAVGLRDWPDDILHVTVSRPGRPIQHTDPHIWPTPVLSFLRHARWLPLESEETGGIGFVRPDEAWAAFIGEMPSFAHPLLRPIRRLLDDPYARARLERLGLHVWEDPEHSGYLLRSLVDILAKDGIREHLAVTFKSQYRRAWNDLVERPGLWPWTEGTEPVVAVMEGARLRPFTLAGDRPLYVPDDDDPAKRMLLELSGRPVLVIDPQHGAAAAGLLAAHGANAVVTSEISLDVYGDDFVITPDPSLPRLVDNGRSWLNTVIGLVIDLNSGPFSRRGERGMRATMETLQRVRLVRPTAVQLVIDGHDVEAPDGTTSLPIEDATAPTLVVWQTGSIWDQLEAAAGSLAQLLNQASLVHPLRATFMGLARVYGNDDPPTILTDATLAKALRVAEDEIRERRGGLRSPVLDVLERIRPVVQYWGGAAALTTFDDTTRSAAEDSALIGALELTIPDFPLAAKELLNRCRDSRTLADVRDSLDLDLRRFNDALAALDPTQTPVTYRARHIDAFRAFLEHRRAVIVDRLRELYLAVFLAAGDLTPYGEARDLAGLEPDPDWLQEFVTPSEEIMAARAKQWLTELGATADLERPTDLPALEELRRTNFEHLSGIVARADTVTRTWCYRHGVARPEPWDNAPLNRARSAMETSYGSDFAELSSETLLSLVASSLGWPDGMPATIDLELLGLTESELMSKQAIDKTERERRLRERTHIRADGHDLPVGIEHFAALAEAANASLTEMFLSKTGRMELHPVPPRAPSRSHDRRAPGLVVARNPQLSEDQRTAVGLFGEVAAKAWLERHYSDVKWMSGFRNIVLGDNVGSDSLGYDFEARRGTKRLFFEVKALLAASSDAAEFDLSEAEIRSAQRHVRGDTYRVLVVTAALDSSEREIFELPNPLSPAGIGRYTLLGRGLRYRCSFDR